MRYVTNACHEFLNFLLCLDILFSSFSDLVFVFLSSSFFLLCILVLYIVFSFSLVCPHC